MFTAYIASNETKISQGKPLELVLYYLHRGRHLHVRAGWSQRRLSCSWLLLRLAYRGIVRIEVAIPFPEELLGFFSSEVAFISVVSVPPGPLVDFWGEGAFPEVGIDLFFFLFDFLFDFLFVPQVDPVEEVGIAMGEVTFILLYHRLEGALYIDFMFIVVVLFH